MHFLDKFLKSDYQSTKLTKQLAKWYAENQRDLPWRKDKNPYKIWLSEVILQQTRIDQGTAYYQKFTKNYPTVKHLASASIDKVLKDWQGLGYYSRARNLHYTAKLIANDLKGRFPTDYESLKQLKGVGNYTAAAIASIAYEQPVAVVDGNVYRVLSRYFGLATPIDSTQGKKEFEFLADSVLDRKNPGNHNQAMMDFGATICTPKKPLCNECPFNDSCFAFSKNKQLSFPVKSKSVKVKSRHFHFFLIRNSNGFFIRKRTGKDIWHGLYELPLLENENLTLTDVKKISGQKKMATIPQPVFVTKHVLSHQVIQAAFYVININGDYSDDSFVNVTAITYKKYAVSRLTERFFETKVFKNSLLK